MSKQTRRIEMAQWMGQRANFLGQPFILEPWCQQLAASSHYTGESHAIFGSVKISLSSFSQFHEPGKFYLQHLTNSTMLSNQPNWKQR